MGQDFLRERFGIKIFAVFTLLVFFISASFTAFFVHEQRQSLKQSLLRQGELLLDILADTSRIGVFSENTTLLKIPFEGVLHQAGVLEVLAFNAKGRLLMRRQKPGPGTTKTGGQSRNLGRIWERVRELGPFHLEGRGTLELWGPVVSGSAYTTEAPLYPDEIPLPGNARVIGFVGIVLDKTLLSRRARALLLESTLLGMAFLLVGCGVTYFLARGVARPLKRLTEGVIALGNTGIVSPLPVETKDEVGRLAKAFNSMASSLKKREQALRQSQEALRALSSQLLKAQEVERIRLAKELHDELGQALAVLKHRVRAIQRKLETHQSAAAAECEETKAYIDEIIENVRRLSRDLSPSILEDLGLSAALRWLVENFAQQHGIEAAVEVADTDHLLSSETQRNIYRVFQEALTNVSKHARAAGLRFVVTREDESLSFVLEDDGKGFDFQRSRGKNEASGGMGLATMEERAHMMGADLQVFSGPGKGTKIALSIALGRGGAADGAFSNSPGRRSRNLSARHEKAY